VPARDIGRLVLPISPPPLLQSRHMTVPTSGSVYSLAEAEV